MLERGDGFVYLLFILLILLWIWKPWKKRRSPQSTAIPKTGKMVQLLEEEGYELISGKVRIPLTLFIGERERETAITADCIVKLNGRTYIVQTEREPGRSLSVKRVREQYVSPCLAFRAHGVVVVNADKTRLKHVDISVKHFSAPSRLRWGLISFLLGAGLTFFWLY